jgi:pimeloyl-ACP methyl ester carboxylesterase
MAPRSGYVWNVDSETWRSGNVTTERASSETSSAFFRDWKSGKRCSEKRLGERLRYRILPSKEGQAWSGHYLIGFSMGSGTTARVLMQHPPQVKSAILAGVGDYALYRS